MSGTAESTSKIPTPFGGMPDEAMILIDAVRTAAHPQDLLQSGVIQ